MQRNITIDAAKFVCLVLMVLCHIPNPEGVFPLWVCSFHMPLFFVASGLFFNPDKYSVVKDFKGLIIPYIIFNCILTVVGWLISLFIVHHILTLEDVVPDLCGIVLGSNMKAAPYEVPIGPSWFLLALFWIKIFAKGLTYFNIKSALLIWFAVMLLYFIIEDSFSWWLWSLNCAVLGSGFFLFGYYYQNKILTVLSYPKNHYLIPLFLAMSILSVNNGLVNIHRGAYGDNILWYYVFAICGTFFILLISKYIHIHHKILKVFMYGSIFIICTNMWLIDYLSLPYFKLIDNFDPLGWPQKIFLTILVFIVSYPCILLLGKYVPWILGRTKRLES